MNGNTLFPAAAPDFGNPLGLLRACHERVLQHCDTLEKLAIHIAEKGVDQEAQTAAAQVHRYFSVAGKHHHQDEELDLFPRLARQSPQLADQIHQLKQDHELIDTLWEQIAPQLSHPGSIEDSAAFTVLVQQLTDAYRSHVQKENEELLDMARHILGSDELKAIGEKMAERRGVKLQPH